MKFENSALFLRLRFPFMVIPHKNEAFRKRFLNGGICKRWLCVLVWTENRLKTITKTFPEGGLSDQVSGKGRQLAPVYRKLDNAIYRRNRSPMDKC